MKKKLVSGIVELLIGIGGLVAVFLCEPKFWGIPLFALGLWIIIAICIKPKDERMSDSARRFAKISNIVCVCLWLLIAAYLYFYPSEKFSDNTLWIYFPTYIFLIAHGVSVCANQKRQQDQFFPRIKFYLKHHGKPGSGCSEPLGICIIIGFEKLTEYPLTQKEIEFGYGTGSVFMENGKLMMAYDQITDIGDGTIPIIEDFSIGQYVAEKFGYKDIIIRKDNYVVNYDKKEKYPYGYSFFNVDLK